MGLRNTAINTEATTLTFQLYRDGLMFDAYALVRVQIFASETNAVSGIDPIAEINPENIARISLGCYQYIVPTITTVGTYYDKITLIPLETSVTSVSFINSFKVSALSGSGSPSTNKCTIYGSIIDSQGEFIEGSEIVFTLDDTPIIDSLTNSVVRPEPIVVVTDANGAFSVRLIKNLTYRYTIRGISNKAKIKVPETDSALLWGLTNIPVVITVPTTPAPTEDPSSPGSSTPTNPPSDW